MPLHGVFRLRHLGRIFLVLLFALNWSVVLLILLRFQHFLHTSPTPALVLFLVIPVAGLHFLLRILRNQTLTQPIRFETILFAGPGILSGLILVVPGCDPLAILLYVTVFLLSFCPLSLNRKRELIEMTVKKQDEDEADEEGLEEELEDVDEEESGKDTQVTMEARRSETDNGQEQLDVSLRVPFEQNERLKYVHIPFYPGFGRSPELETYQLEGEEIEIIIAKLTSYGVRLDIKRPMNRTDEETVKIVVICRGDRS